MRQLNNHGFSIIETVVALGVLTLIIGVSSQFLLSAVKESQRTQNSTENSKLSIKLKEIMSEQSSCSCLLASLKDTPIEELNDDKKINLKTIDLNGCGINSIINISDKSSNISSKINKLYLDGFTKLDKNQYYSNFIFETLVTKGSGGDVKTFPILIDYDEDGNFSTCQTLKSTADNNTNIFMNNTDTYSSSTESSELWWDKSRSCLVEESLFSEAMTMPNLRQALLANKDSLANALDIPKNFSWGGEYGDVNFLSYDPILSPVNGHIPPSIFGNIADRRLYRFYAPLSVVEKQTSWSKNLLKLTNQPLLKVPLNKIKALKEPEPNIPDDYSNTIFVPAISIHVYNELTDNNITKLKDQEAPTISEIRSHWYIGSTVGEGSTLPIITRAESIREYGPSGSAGDYEHKMVWTLKYGFCFNGTMRILKKHWPVSNAKDEQ